MDNLRVFLWVGLGISIWFTFQTWQQDYAPVRAPVYETAPGQLPDTASAESESASGLPALPELPGSSSTAEPARVVETTETDQALIHVRTDVLDLEIDLQGGDIHSAKLPAYPIHKDTPDVPVILLNPDTANRFIYRTGLRAADGRKEPNHLVAYQASQDEYQLTDGASELVVELTWQGDDGVSAKKVYSFRRGEYEIDLDYIVKNDGTEPYRAISYLQMQRRHIPVERSMFNVDSYSYVGPVIYNGEKYEKLDVEDLIEEPLEGTWKNGWVASIQHHFLAAAVPPAEEDFEYSVTSDGQTYLLSAAETQFRTVTPGEKLVFPGKLFIGPKLQSQLKETVDSLPLTVDFGILTVLAQPLFWLLQKVHSFVGNWGWSIILVTLMIKAVFYKLTQTSGRSMAKMRKLQPRLKALQERHKDDREALSRAMMDIYKREKVNPAAGCLPMLIQIPFFISFYWVLLESVEMRQAPFMLWITDLSTKDPYFVLPLLMGAAMFFQQKLNPAPPDPIQAKVMQFLPVMFTVFFAFFPAGLVLYWLTNSVASMLQQWRINKVLGAD
jgi:YidC/Oxa1 family membrane protein insertase